VIPKNGKRTSSDAELLSNIENPPKKIKKDALDPLVEPFTKPSFK
jgi:hypothetical protein